MGLAKTLECEIALTFRQQNLAEQYAALATDCNLYIVSRRPRTYIEEHTVRITRRGWVKGSYIIVKSGNHVRRKFKFPIPVDIPSRYLRWGRDLPKDYFRIIDGRTGDNVLHGDPWSLLHLISGASSKLAAQEVLYVGKSTGRIHERNAFDRIKRHDKVQQIYADNAGADQDVFLSVLRINDSSSVAMLSGSTDFDIVRGNIGELVARSLSTDRKVFVDSVELTEAALIAYFKPRYNRNHKHNFPHKPSKVSELLKKYRYSNLTVALHDNGTGIQFWSNLRSGRRFHAFRCTLPSPKEIENEAFVESADDMDRLLSRPLNYVDKVAHKAVVTLALLPAAAPERFLPDDT